MRRDEVEIEKFRKKLEKDGFFEDVILGQASVVLNETDGGISGWMYYLKKYKKIEVKRFILSIERSYLSNYYYQNVWEN